MDFKKYKESLQHSSPPSGLSSALQGLWYDAKGDWHKAHATVQSDNSRAAAWVHAYLHRKEGDHSNASYWYSKADEPVYRGSLEAEWQDMVETLIEEV